VKELEATLALQRLRLDPFELLAETAAASQFEVEQTAAQIEQLEARLRAARAVLTFVDMDQLAIFAIFGQKALPNVKVGDRVIVNFPALRGRVFETEVREFVSGIQEGQILATGPLDPVLRQRMVRGYPLLVSLPEDFPPELHKVGLAANATILTEAAGPIAIVAIVTQWIATSLDAVL
jgi:hypothetical protein